MGDPKSQEEPKRTKHFREFRGCFTRSTRQAIPDDRFYNLENLIPIGHSNIHTVPDKGALLFDYGTDAIYWSQYANLNSTNYLVNFSSGGKVFAYNLDANTNTQINPFAPFSGSNSRMSQWKNSQWLFIDGTGYYNYDGVTTQKIAGSGVPTKGDDIAVYQNRIWITNGRQLVVSNIDDFTSASFTAANGAQTINLTDPDIRDKIVRLWAQNGYLYYFTSSTIGAISDVYIPTGASPPTPVMTRENIQGIIGTDQPASIFAFDRYVMFATRYGVYALLGITAQRISDDIDGTWQYIDFSQSVSGGQCIVRNILNASFLIKRKNDPVFGSNTVIAMWFPNIDGSDNRWWFANYGAVTIVSSAIINGAPALYGFIGNKLFQLFGGDPTTTSPATQAMTALWAMEDPLSDKQVIRAGFEVATTSVAGNFTLNVDGPTGTFAVPNLAVPANPIVWTNNSGNPVSWQNNSGSIVSWYNASFLLFNGAAPGGYAQYVGLTLNGAVNNVYELDSLIMDYKLRAKWHSGP
jgi:hypothetical protein